METHIIYIITDSNRAYLEIEYCTDLPTRMQEIRNIPSRFFHHAPRLNNIVYIQTFNSKEKALAYYQTLRDYTRMQREKLIRMKNPNWLNLFANPSCRKDVAFPAALPTRHKV